ncbi:hypothetical protein EDB84DRAFT_1572368 [Lactarius hengduanensis]|nr:hypothetical protein EDB84DRAFT_1572368 [Lactarius hengduanensis]
MFEFQPTSFPPPLPPPQFPRHGKYRDAQGKYEDSDDLGTHRPPSCRQRPWQPRHRIIRLKGYPTATDPSPFARTHRPPHPPARTRDMQATDRQCRAQLPPPPRTSSPSRRHHLNTDTAISTPLNCHHLNSRHTCRTASTATTAATNHHPMPATPPPRQPARAAATSTAAITTADHHPPATPPPQQPNPPQQPTNPVLPPPPHPAQPPWPDLVPLLLSEMHINIVVHSDSEHSRPEELKSRLPPPPPLFTLSLAKERLDVALLVVLVLTAVPMTAVGVESVQAMSHPIFGDFMGATYLYSAGELSVVPTCHSQDPTKPMGNRQRSLSGKPPIPFPSLPFPSSPSIIAHADTHMNGRPYSASSESYLFPPPPLWGPQRWRMHCVGPSVWPG